MIIMIIICIVINFIGVAYCVKIILSTVAGGDGKRKPSWMVLKTVNGR